MASVRADKNAGLKEVAALRSQTHHFTLPCWTNYAASRERQQVEEIGTGEGKRNASLFVIYNANLANMASTETICLEMTVSCILNTLKFHLTADNFVQTSFPGSGTV